MTQCALTVVDPEDIPESAKKPPQSDDEGAEEATPKKKGKKTKATDGDAEEEKPKKVRSAMMGLIPETSDKGEKGRDRLGCRKAKAKEKGEPLRCGPGVTIRRQRRRPRRKSLKRMKS